MNGWVEEQQKVDGGKGEENANPESSFHGGTFPSAERCVYCIGWLYFALGKAESRDVEMLEGGACAMPLWVWLLKVGC